MVESGQEIIRCTRGDDILKAVVANEVKLASLEQNQIWIIRGLKELKENNKRGATLWKTALSNILVGIAVVVAGAVGAMVMSHVQGR